MQRTSTGFTSILGTVTDDTYVGKTIAGGEGTELRLSASARPVLTFDHRCGFLAQIRNSRIIAIETDRNVKAHLGQRTLSLSAHHPQHF